MLRRHRASIVVGVVVVGALALLITAALMAPGRSDDIWVNLAGSAAQIVVLALAGGVVGAVLRDRDVRREDARRNRQSVLEFADKVELAFHEIKAARRILRTFGFDAPVGLVLTREQATGFRAQMAQLNDTELSVEMFRRVVGERRSLFDPNTESLQQELAGVSRYLRHVLLEWETDSTVVERGAGRVHAHRVAALRELRRLRRRIEPGVQNRHRRAADAHRAAADEHCGTHGRWPIGLMFTRHRRRSRWSTRPEADGPARRADRLGHLAPARDGSVAVAGEVDHRDRPRLCRLARVDLPGRHSGHRASQTGATGATDASEICCEPGH